MNKLIWLYLLLIGCACISGPASWSMDTNINAGTLSTHLGQHKAIVMNVATVPGTTTVIQRYNNSFVPATTFTNIPTVSLGLQGYAQGPPSNPLNTVLGFTITLSSITTTGFTSTITVYGVTMAMLLYIYFAVQLQSSIYCTAFYSYTFPASDPMANSTSATRSIQKIIPNPGGVTNSNYLTNQIIYYSFLSGFNLISKTTGIYISVNASVNNASSFKVDLATCGDISVTAVSFFLISCDVTAAMATYTRIIDLYYWQMLVNVEKDGPIPVTDISTQTFYRNNIYGLHHLDYPIGNVAFYLNNTAYDSNLLLFYGIHQRMRSCPERTPYYYHAVQLCFDVCPSYTYTNTSFNFCVACKYSCSKCDNPLVSLSCTQCASSDNRVLNGTNCDCAVGYFQQPGSIATCGTCNYRCVTCTSSSNLSCSSCDVTLHRQFANGNSCPCLAGYYQNVTCMSCPTGCLACSMVSSAVICSSCDTSLSLTLSSDNTACVCQSAYYNSTSNTCLPCSTGCLACSIVSTVLKCSFCDTSLHLQLNSDNTACVCQSTYHMASDNTCQQCDASCASCPTSGSRLSCICTGGLVGANNTCIGVCGDGKITGLEECDDNNISDGDGCSSLCKVQPNATCTLDTNILPYSLCYYSSPIKFSINTITKIPLKNEVNLIMNANAQGCNPNLFKSYLEAPGMVSLVLLDNSNKRILQSAMVSHSRQLAQGSTILKITNISYDIPSKLLNLIFIYNKTIDLSTQSLQFVSSGSTNSPYSRYFYSTPPVQIMLQHPYNNLPTIYYDPVQYNGVSTLQIVYLVVLAIHLMYLLAALIMRQTAPAVEAILVLQIASCALISQDGVSQAWLGMLSIAKYTYGYNIQLQSTVSANHLSALTVDANMLNTFNITLFIQIIVLVSSLGLYVYRRVCSQEADTGMSESSGTVSTVSNDQPTFSSKLEEYLWELLLALTLLTCCVWTIEFCFISTAALLPSLAIGLTLLVVYLTTWLSFYLLRIPKQISFVKLRIPLDSENYGWITTLTNMIKRHQYLLVFIGMMLFGIMCSFDKTQGIVSFVLVGISAAVVILFLWRSGLYKSRWHDIRVMVSCGLLIGIVILQLAATASENQMTVAIPVNYCVVVLLVTNVAFSAGTTFRLFFIDRSVKNEAKEQAKQLQALYNQITMGNNRADATLPTDPATPQRPRRNLRYENSITVTKDQPYYSTIKRSLITEKLPNESFKKTLQDKSLQLQDIKRATLNDKTIWFEQSLPLDDTLNASKVVNEPNVINWTDDD